MEFGIKQLGDLSGLAWEVAQICLVIAVLVVVVVELLKSLFKPMFQYRALYRWLEMLDGFLDLDIKVFAEFDDYPHLKSMARRREEARDGQNSSPPAHDVDWHFLLSPYAFRLPGQLFMQRVEAQARQILATPAKYPDALFVLASGASVRDREIAVETGDLGGDMSPQQQIAIGRVSAAIDNQLDNLQLEITQRWQDIVRRMAVVSGMVLALVLGVTTAEPAGAGNPSTLAIVRFTLSMLAIGVLSGFAATVLYDLLTRLTRARGEGF